MARHRAPRELFPGPLREFREEDWPPLPGECLDVYACRYGGYEAGCCPRPGEFCGELHYEMLARDYPDEPWLLVRAKTADAYRRFMQARLSWLGEDHPEHFTEMVAGWGEDQVIRYGREFSSE